MLYNLFQTINKNLMIKAQNGKPMSALKITAETLRYLKVHALETIGDHTSGRQFIASDVTWVLTVPAIWDAAAKQFMREAATEVIYGTFMCCGLSYFTCKHLAIILKYDFIEFSTFASINNHNTIVPSNNYI